MTSKILLLVTILLSFKSLKAQNTIPIDSVSRVLCHKWGFKAILMGGQRLTNMNESVTYEFVSDGTFRRVSSNGKKEKGTWTYNSDEKVVQLKLKKTKLYISSMSRDELIVSPGDSSIGNEIRMGTILKLIDNN